jgi:hypothetical protein
MQRQRDDIVCIAADDAFLVVGTRDAEVICFRDAGVAGVKYSKQRWRWCC